MDPSKENLLEFSSTVQVMEKHLKEIKKRWLRVKFMTNAIAKVVKHMRKRLDKIEHLYE